MIEDNEFIFLGLLYSLMTITSTFVFNYEMNAIGISLGMLVFGIVFKMCNIWSEKK